MLDGSQHGSDSSEEVARAQSIYKVARSIQERLLMALETIISHSCGPFDLCTINPEKLVKNNKKKPTKKCIQFTRSKTSRSYKSINV